MSQSTLTASITKKVDGHYNKCTQLIKSKELPCSFKKTQPKCINKYKQVNKFSRQQTGFQVMVEMPPVLSLQSRLSMFTIQYVFTSERNRKRTGNYFF